MFFTKRRLFIIIDIDLNFYFDYKNLLTPEHFILILKAGATHG